MGARMNASEISEVVFSFKSLYIFTSLLNCTVYKIALDYEHRICTHLRAFSLFI